MTEQEEQRFRLSLSIVSGTKTYLNPHEIVLLGIEKISVGMGGVANVDHNVKKYAEKIVGDVIVLANRRIYHELGKRWG